MQVISSLCCLLSFIFLDIPVWTLFCFPSTCPIFLSSSMSSIGKISQKPGVYQSLVQRECSCLQRSYRNSSLLLAVWLTMFALLTLPLQKITGGLKLLYTVWGFWGGCCVGLSVCFGGVVFFLVVFFVICWSHWCMISMLQSDFLLLLLFLVLFCLGVYNLNKRREEKIELNRRGKYIYFF